MNSSKTVSQLPVLESFLCNSCKSFAKALRFIERAEAQTAQANEMMSAIQSAMDEVKKEFLTDTTEKKKRFTFSS